MAIEMPLELNLSLSELVALSKTSSRFEVRALALAVVFPVDVRETLPEAVIRVLPRIRVLAVAVVRTKATATWKGELTLPGIEPRLIERARTEDSALLSELIVTSPELIMVAPSSVMVASV